MGAQTAGPRAVNLGAPYPETYSPYQMPPRQSLPPYPTTSYASPPYQAQPPYGSTPPSGTMPGWAYPPSGMRPPMPPFPMQQPSQNPYYMNPYSPKPWITYNPNSGGPGYGPMPSSPSGTQSGGQLPPSGYGPGVQPGPIGPGGVIYRGGPSWQQQQQWQAQNPQPGPGYGVNWSPSGGFQWNNWDVPNYNTGPGPR